MLLEELGDMLESQGLYSEAVRVYNMLSVLIREEVQTQCGNVGLDETMESDPVEIVDLKRCRGLVLQKLGKIYQNDAFKDSDIEQAISTYKTAIKMVHGVNNKQNIALMLQSLLTQVNRDHEVNQFREYLPDNNLSDSMAD